MIMTPTERDNIPVTFPSTDRLNMFVYECLCVYGGEGGSLTSVRVQS